MPNVDMFKFPEMKQRIFEQLDSYSGIPFTMQVLPQTPPLLQGSPTFQRTLCFTPPPQRLCELLTQPRRHYKRVDKFMRGLEKVGQAPRPP